MNITTLDLEFLNLDHAIAAFVVEGSDGLSLVECGPASTLPHLQAAMREKNWKIEDVRRVFLSHIHFDHAGAAWAFAEKGATIYVHPKGLPHLAAPERLYNSARMIYGEQMDTLWGEMRPIEETLLYAPQHGETITVGDQRFTSWYTPGHASHHIAWELHEGDQSVIFSGDVAGVKIGNGPVQPPCPPPDIDIEAWLQSIQLMRELDAPTLLLTHFGVITDKHSHLDSLERHLQAWAQWMRPHFDAGTAAETIIPLFKEFVAEELRASGLDDEGIKRYEAANPAFMSVAGLLRYWKKASG